MNLRRISSVAVIATTVFAIAGFAATVAAQSSYYDDLYTTTAATDTAASATFLGLYGFSLICLCCLPLIVDVALAIWIYKDAKKHNVENPALWAVLTFFFSLIGLLVYLLAIRPDAIKKQEGGHATHTTQVVEGSTVEDKKPE